jgi:hypothetical protein
LLVLGAKLQADIHDCVRLNLQYPDSIN